MLSYPVRWRFYVIYVFSCDYNIFFSCFSLSQTQNCIINAISISLGEGIRTAMILGLLVFY